MLKFKDGRRIKLTVLYHNPNATQKGTLILDLVALMMRRQKMWFL